MTRHIIRFLNESDRADSYNNLFGRNEVLNILRKTPTVERTERAVQEYCGSLRLLCDFKYVSSAIILEPNEESIRYFLVYATNHPRGVEVFKAAEIKAARIQDDVRLNARIRKTGQPELIFDAASPKSRLSLDLQQRYAAHARKRIHEILSANTLTARLPYSDLFCAAMEFPLVTPHDLVGWLQALEPHIKIQLEGTGRKKPSPMKDDYIVIINPMAIR
jgi:hypothetical protein